MGAEHLSMGTKHFSFRYGDPERVRVKTGLLNRSATIYLDDVLVGQIDDQKALFEGHRVALADGSYLTVTLLKGANSGIEVVHASAHGSVTLEGSPSTPTYKIDGGANAAYFVAACSLLIGVLAAIGVLAGLGFGWFTVAVGTVFAGLGYAMKRTHSLAASATAAGLWVVDVLIQLATLDGAPSGLIPRLLIAFLLIRAVPAAKEARKLKAVGLAPTTPEHAGVA